MKSILRVCTVALATAALYASPPASAALPPSGGGGFTYVDPCNLNFPTAADCQDPTWLNAGCGAQEQRVPGRALRLDPEARVRVVDR